MSVTLSQPTLATPAPPRRRPWRVMTRRLMRSPQTLIGGAITLVFAFLAVFGPTLAPYSPTAMQMSKRLSPPSPTFLLGTDEFGRDILSRLLYGARPSFEVGLFSVLFALFIGMALGVIVGYRGGYLDTFVMLAMDVLFAFPAVLLAIAIMAILRPSLFNVILAIGIVSLPIFVRLARGSTLGVRNLLYVEAAQSVGVRPLLIAFRHILPNIMAPQIVQASLTIAAAILTEAALSYLGLGNPPPAPSWGNMLATGYGFMQVSPWPAIFPGLAIMLAVLGFNLLGDGLRDILDPTLRLD